MIAKTITIETHRQVVIRSRRKSFFDWCAACRAETLMLTPEQAAILDGTTQRHIFRRLENGKLHFIETEAGALLICRNSLVGKGDKTTGEDDEKTTFAGNVFAGLDTCSRVGEGADKSRKRGGKSLSGK